MPGSTSLLPLQLLGKLVKVGKTDCRDNRMRLYRNSSSIVSHDSITLKFPCSGSRPRSSIQINIKPHWAEHISIFIFCCLTHNTSNSIDPLLRRSSIGRMTDILAVHYTPDLSSLSLYLIIMVSAIVKVTNDVFDNYHRRHESVMIKMGDYF